MSFAKLDARCRKLEALSHARAMLGVDEAVQMPEGGGEKRAEALAQLAAMSHELLTDPHVGDWLAKAETEALSPQQQAAVRELKRDYLNATCLSGDFVAKQVETNIKSEQLWRAARSKGDWHGFLPLFSEVIALVREEAQRRAEILKLDPYDALIEQYDPGSRASQIDPIFAELKTFLKGFLPQALSAQEKRLAQNPAKDFAGTYAIDRQKDLGLKLMAAIGFDFDHGRLDISHHPFCGGVPSDVRMTTRYREDEFLSSLMGILHETGHGLYEQGLPKDWSHWSVGHARGMALHESQSLFVEMQLARTPAFWRYALPIAQATLANEPLKSWQQPDILSHIHKVKPGFIRVDADEVTYPLHIIMRYEMEKDLVSGKLLPRDIPEVWDAKMKDYLNLSTLADPANGPMQDVHWPSGSIGYFPSYTLGALFAAQQWAAISKTTPQVSDEIAKGDFTSVNNWRRDHIWSKASSLSTPELISQATGEPLTPRYFIAHLKQRYLPEA